MNYFLNINKPPNCTSHDVVSILRRQLGIKKIGHAGTLDPFATGVLVIGLNEATRLFEYLHSNKEYLAEITFGIETDSNDITGKIIKEENTFPTLDEIKEKINSFVGKIKQKPPTFSAIKLNGQRAYKLARKNLITLDDIKEKEVEIYKIDTISHEESKLQLKIHCSSGTYIRSLARDLGYALNTYATLSSLQRIKVGEYFKIEESVTIEEINKNNLEEYLMNPSKVLTIPKIKLNDLEIRDISLGKTIVETRCGVSLWEQKNIQLINENNEIIGIGTIIDNSIIQPKKVFITS